MFGHIDIFNRLPLQLHGAKPNDEFIVDPKRLRCWLRHMQNELSKFPSISDAIKMKDFELMKLQKKILVSEPLRFLFIYEPAVFRGRRLVNLQ